DHTVHPAFVMKKDGTVELSSTKKETSDMLLDALAEQFIEQTPQTELFDYWCPRTGVSASSVSERA
ncbi:MAG: hypothetical protein KAJ24_06445, partial [Candidatus Aenigmarchaeota archaeon]|nr:hypothetical protein [Candidatus Aenigmarchaeota archaeon]